MRRPARRELGASRSEQRPREGFGSWRLGDDDALLDIVTSANVACGFHACAEEVGALRGGRTLRVPRSQRRGPIALHSAMPPEKLPSSTTGSLLTSLHLTFEHHEVVHPATPPGPFWTSARRLSATVGIDDEHARTIGIVRASGPAQQLPLNFERLIATAGVVG
jgi:hypothetical protein